ncbi:hypothetical protein MNBD_GAMMA12-1837 [hydrothermal vent metagenome]|uniref:DUF4177 domain-containing protein n=1 Tax=hydrothermal vent metagenome TaxID=652676 RepID=A0A3B0Y5W2_9ZZZZ
MQMIMTYLAAEHKDLPPGSSNTADTFSPDAGVITTELNSDLYNKHLNEMGDQGWQLLSVQPIHKVEYTHIQNISVIGGFYFFWQKPADNGNALAFPMTSPSFPGAQPVQANNFQAAVKGDKTPGAPKNIAIKSQISVETSNKTKPESTQNNSEAQVSAKPIKTENRVSSIKKLLVEKSSKNHHKPQKSIDIPTDANTQLLRDIEDIHNLRSANNATAAKQSSPPLPHSKQNSNENVAKSTSKKQINKAIDEDLGVDADFDLDFDLDFDDVENTEYVKPKK